MSEIIQISVAEKIASTTFREVVTNNSCYLLSFAFDEEWNNFEKRVAVAMWEGGCAERMFTGSECELPVISADCEYILVGVYAVNESARIASTYVRFPCRAGARSHFCGDKKALSLAEQMLAFLNGKDWSLFDEKMEAGTYSSVTVNAQGIVVAGGKVTKEELGLASVYIPSGTLTFAELPVPSAALLGNVYNVSNAFITDDRFLEGANLECGAGSNVAVIKRDGDYYYDLLGGIPDLSAFVMRTELQEIALQAYPVGALYLSMATTSPASLFGGTWTRISDVYLYAAGPSYPVGATGGEATHTLTLSEMPKHRHVGLDWNGEDSIGNSGDGGTFGYSLPLSEDGTGVLNSWRTGVAGGGEAHNNMPPFLSVNIWKRTA